MAKLDKIPEILNRPTFGFTECRYLLDMDIRTWRDVWRRRYSGKVDHIETVNGIRIAVESLVAALFPRIANDPLSLAKMTLEMIVQMRRIRVERREKTRKKRTKTRDRCRTDPYKSRL